MIIQNKEDLIVSTYVRIKEKLSVSLMKDLDFDLPFRDVFHQLWRNIFDFTSSHKEYYQYSEQFANSPYSALVDREEVEKHLKPIIQLFTQAIERKIIKNVPLKFIHAFTLYTANHLSNSLSRGLWNNYELNEENIENAFLMAWDAIKL